MVEASKKMLSCPESRTILLLKGRSEMTVERVGPPDPISRFNKTQKTEKPARKHDKDSVHVSEDAKLKAEIYTATEQVRMSPDVRLDRVEEVKKKLEDPNYISDKVIDTVAEKLMDQLSI